MPDTNGALTLPDEFVLLLHNGEGAHYPIEMPTVATSAARVGELALRSRVRVEDRKLYVIDESPAGIPWFDELLGRFAKKGGGEGKPVDLGSWLTFELSTFSEHRDFLVQNSLLDKRTKKTLGFIKSSEYYPEPGVRDRVLAELSAVARSEREPGNRTAVLAAIVHACGLDKKLGFTDSERARLDRIAKGEELGESVEAVVAELAIAITTTMTVVLFAATGQ